MFNSPQQDYWIEDEAGREKSAVKNIAREVPVAMDVEGLRSGRTFEAL